MDDLNGVSDDHPPDFFLVYFYARRTAGFALFHDTHAVGELFEYTPTPIIVRTGANASTNTMAEEGAPSADMSDAPRDDVSLFLHVRVSF